MSNSVEICLSHCYFGVQLDTQCHKLEFCWITGTVKSTDPGRRYSRNINVESWTVRSWRRANNLFSSSTIVWKCVREELNTAVEYLDHISAGCKVKNRFPSWWWKNPKQKVTMLLLDIPFAISVLKNISWRVIRMNQTLSRMNQIMTTLLLNAKEETRY